MTAAADGMTADALDAVTELLALRGQPIALNPVGAMVEKPGGGYGPPDQPPAPRDPQTLALFKTDAFDGQEDSQTDQGQSRKFSYNLIGAPDAVVLPGDWWEDVVAKYTVQSVDYTKPYQVSAAVTGFLKVQGHSFG